MIDTTEPRFIELRAEAEAQKLTLRGDTARQWLQVLDTHVRSADVWEGTEGDYYRIFDLYLKAAKGMEVIDSMYKAGKLPYKLALKKLNTLKSEVLTAIEHGGR